MTSWRSLTKIAGSGSIRQRYGSADPDPDPYQNFMAAQHSKKYCMVQVEIHTLSQLEGRAPAPPARACWLCSSAPLLYVGYHGPRHSCNTHNSLSVHKTLRISLPVQKKRIQLEKGSKKKTSERNWVRNCHFCQLPPMLRIRNYFFRIRILGLDPWPHELRIRIQEALN